MKDKDLYLKVTFISIAVLLIYSLLAFLSASTTTKHIRDKDKFIELETNTLGCVKYRYNSDVVWKCPVNTDLTQIEEQSCHIINKMYTCEKIHIPVIKETYK